MVTNAIEKAQRSWKVTTSIFVRTCLNTMMWLTISIKVVLAQRDSLLDTDDIGETIADLRAEVVNTLISQFIPPESLEEQWDVKGLERALDFRAERRDADSPRCWLRSSTMGGLWEFPEANHGIIEALNI